ncbi:MAG TPA: glutathione transferase [Myxococcales bacterium]|jgi:glutathione S-transferase
MKLILYGTTMWASPYVFSCYVALREKELPFEMRLLALDKGEHRSAEYARLSLTGRVPALLDGDFAVSESSAIVEYLDEQFPEGPRLLPAETAARARARQVMAWMRSDFAALRSERSSQYVFFPLESLPPPPPLSKEGMAAAKRLVNGAAALVPQGGGSLFGAWSVADCDLAMMLQRLHRTGFELPANIARYVEAQWARPTVQEWVAQPRPAYREPA